MINKPKFASIDSFDKEQLKELFDHISIEILKSTPLKIKQDILKLKGTPKELEEFNPTIQSILNLIATYDLKFELVIKYIEVVKPDFSALDLEQTPIQKEMSKQKKDVKAEVAEPVIKKVEIPVNKEVTEEKKTVNDDDLPEFN